jgi:endonuclease-8
MPEGDTIFRAARSLRLVLLNQTIQSAGSPRQLVDAESLVGCRVTGIESRGKHLLMFLHDERVLHSHMGMTGSWHIYPKGTSYNKPRKWAAVELLLDECAVVCFSPQQFELLTPQQFRRHGFLRRLGPDLLAGEIDWEEVQRRFRTHPSTPLGEALLNQTIGCGAGNVYKSEVLFLCGLSPFRAVASVGDEHLLSLLKRCRSLMLRNLEGHPRKTRFGNAGGRLWVYGRAGEDCLKCGHTIEMRRQGDLGRSTYYCPECQPAGSAAR